MRLRQVALVASELEPVKKTLFSLLGIARDYQDEGVAEFGLKNSVMAIGDTFLEVVVPTVENSAAGRQLQRRGGDGGYMVLVQSEDIAVDSARIQQLGVRKVWEVARPEVQAFHLHPADLGGAIVSIDQMTPPPSWCWGGPNWQGNKAQHVQEIIAVELQAKNPQQMANRWAEVFGLSVISCQDNWLVPLARGEIRFVQARDGRGDGVCAIDFRCDHVTSIIARAKSMGLAVNGHQVDACGMQFNFIESQ